MLDAAMPATPEKMTSSPSGASAHGSHQLAAANTCERMFFLRYEQKIIPNQDNEPPFRLIGSLVHLCLSYHYQALVPPPHPKWFTDRTLEEAIIEEGRGHMDIIRTAKEVFEYYKQHWAAGDTWRPVYVEHQFAASIGELDPALAGSNEEVDNTILTAKPDLIVEANGDLWIVDHKCTSGYSSDRLPRWKDDGEYLLAWQPMLYLHIVRKRLPHRNVKGFVIQRIKRKSPYDVDRNPLRIPARSYSQVPRTARMLVEKEMTIRERVAEGIPPIPNFSACYGRYGPCDYRPLCAADSDATKRSVMETDFVQIGRGGST